jgi:hypothetical protein
MVIAPGFYHPDRPYLEPRLKEQAEKTMRRIVRGLFGLSDGGSEL